MTCRHSRSPAPEPAPLWCSCTGSSLTLLSPARLWNGSTPLYNRASLRVSRWLSDRATTAVEGLGTLTNRVVGARN